MSVNTFITWRQLSVGNFSSNTCLFQHSLKSLSVKNSFSSSLSETPVDSGFGASPPTSLLWSLAIPSGQEKTRAWDFPSPHILKDWEDQDYQSSLLWKGSPPEEGERFQTSQVPSLLEGWGSSLPVRHLGRGAIGEVRSSSVQRCKRLLGISTTTKINMFWKIWVILSVLTVIGTMPTHATAILVVLWFLLYRVK